MSKQTALFLAGFVGYVAWAVIAFHDPSQRPDFLKFNITLVSGAVGIAVRDLKSPSE